MSDDEIQCLFVQLQQRVNTLEEQHAKDAELWALTIRVDALEKEQDRMAWKIRELEREMSSQKRC